MEEDLGEDLGEEEADADYDLNQVEDQKEDQMEEEEEETEEEDRRDDPALTTSSPPPAFITPLVTPNFSSKAFDIRLFFDSNPSLRKNLEWSKLEFLLPTANSLHDIIPRLVPSIQSESYPLHSETILPLFSSPSLPSSKRKFVYYTKEEDNDRRIPFWPSDALDILLRIKDEDLHLLGLLLRLPDWLIWQDFPVSTSFHTHGWSHECRSKYQGTNKFGSHKTIKQSCHMCANHEESYETRGNQIKRSHGSFKRFH